MENVTKTNNDKKKLNPWLGLLIKLSIIGLLVYIATFFVRIDFIHTNEMFPSLRDGDLAISYKLGQYSYGDVVVYKAFEDGEIHYGRIMCINESTVEIDDYGNFLVNGNIVSENSYYQNYNKGDIEYPYKVGNNNVFILQDYRMEMSDSRVFGQIPIDQICGKVIIDIRVRGF